MKILMVCLGNICRSPLAQGILEDKIKKQELPWVVDSCGTGSWHIGEAPDRRSIKIALDYGLDISQQRARQIHPDDFTEYDLILTMDAQNFQDVKKLNGTSDTARIEMILNYLYPGENRAVPDPYFDGKFERVYQLLDKACDKLIEDLT